jgi:hypothetical protein
MVIISGSAGLDRSGRHSCKNLCRTFYSDLSGSRRTQHQLDAACNSKLLVDPN